jgi:hypothetical protein
MKKQGTKDPHRQRNMTRGEFLSVGGSGAVAAALPGAAWEPATAMRASRRAQTSTLQCASEAELDWALPAKHLNTLFSDLLPRVAAAVWANAGPSWPPAPSLGHQLSPNDVKQHIRDNWITFFTNNAANYTAPFIRRLEDLDAYLGVADKSVPVYFIDRPGFDMVLSSEGVDLFPPPDITGFGGAAVSEMMRYYTFRTTGRAPIGLPGVLPSLAPHMIAAATGASQMDRGPAVVTEDLLPALQAIASLEGNPTEILSLCGMFDLLGTDDMWLKIKNLDDESRSSFLVRFLGMDPVTARQSFSDFTTYHGFLEDNLPGGPCTPPTSEWYSCEKKKDRCWQVSGAVYRGMLEQFPRLIAQAWFEQPGTVPSAQFPAQVAAGNPTTLRSRMRERMETALDGEDRMVFGWGPVQPPAPAGDWSGVIDSGGLMITNQGFYFTKPGIVPNLAACLTEIIAGKAGNPVFTDSSQTDA